MLRHFQCYGDDRKRGFCVHCGGADETRDHVPSKVLLDEPLPDNVSVSPACFTCNNGLSDDEQYLACLLDCIVAGDVDPSKVKRPKVAKILRTLPRLAERLRDARKVVNERVLWDIEMDRIANVVLKLARGHTAYELNDPKLDDPISFWMRPLCTLGDEERKDFEELTPDSTPDLGVWPEVGSRMMSRLLVVGSADEDFLGVFEEGWQEVQEGRYRFRLSWEDTTEVKIVIGEYLACKVTWE